MPMVGGIGAAQPANNDVQDICNQVKSDAACHLGQSFDLFEAIQFKTQLVAGTNYFIKVKVGEDKYIHVKVFQSLPHEGSKVKFSSAQEASETAEIVHF